MLLPAELDRIAELIKGHPWQFAKTMPENPHCYTLRKKWPQEQEFEWLVQMIRTHGYREKFKTSWYTMLNVNGHKYWTMGAPLPVTILINEKKLEDCPETVPVPYDRIAPEYDQAFGDEASDRENRQVMRLIGDVSEERILDIGCGTGMFLDYNTPLHYSGIDLSRAMLAVARGKHPEYASNFCLAKLEEYSQPAWFGHIVCLFGAANYIAPEYVAAIPRLVRPGGRWSVMFYKPDYFPVTYAKFGAEVAHFSGVHADLPGKRTEIGNFVLIQGQK